MREHQKYQILPFNGTPHLPDLETLDGHVRGFATNREERAVLIRYGLPERQVFTRGHFAEELDPCLATFRGRAGWLVLARDLRAFGGTKRVVAERADALEKASIRILDISNPQDRTYSAQVQRAHVAISGSRFHGDRRLARRRGRSGGIGNGRAAQQRRDDVSQRWLVDRIVDHRHIPWAVKIELLQPHFSESSLRRHYGAQNASRSA